MINFKLLEEDYDCSGIRRAKWFSNEFRYRDDFSYWFVLSLVGAEHSREFQSNNQYFDYSVCLDVVAPELLPRKEKVLAVKHMGWEEDKKWYSLTIEEKLTSVINCSYSADCGSWMGNNYKKLMKNAAQEAVDTVYFFDENMSYYQTAYTNRWAFLYGRPFDGCLNNKGEKV